MGILGYTILTLCVLGVLCALILYFVAQKFKVYEDPRIDDVEKMVPVAVLSPLLRSVWTICPDCSARWAVRRP